MEIINKFIEILDPKIIEIITMLFTTVTGYIILGIIVLLLLMIIKYHELVEGTKCYSVFLPIPLIKEYFIIKLTSGKAFGWLYVILCIVTSIANLLPIKNESFNTGLDYLIKGLVIFLLINIIVGFFRFIYLWIKEKSINRKYKKLEKEMELKKQYEEQFQNEQLQNSNNNQETINNQQNNIIQPNNKNTFTPTYTEELSFRPNDNINVNINNTNNNFNNINNNFNNNNINQQNNNNFNNN